VIDPAWEYDWLSLAGRAKPGYAMQTFEQLLALRPLGLKPPTELVSGFQARLRPVQPSSSSVTADEKP
jgi:hypothetical protein